MVQKLTRKNGINFLLLVLFAIFISSCNKELSNDFSGSDESATLKKASKSESELVAENRYTEVQDIDQCGDETVVNFLAGQHIPAGTVTIENTADKLYVTVITDNGWDMGHVHLYVGTQDGIPVNKKGNPQIGQFPVSDSFNPHVTTVVYEFDLASLEDCFVVAVHAEAHGSDGHGSETAWAEGTPFGAGSWATYIEYCKQSCTVDPGPR